VIAIDGGFLTVGFRVGLRPCLEVGSERSSTDSTGCLSIPVCFDSAALAATLSTNGGGPFALSPSTPLRYAQDGLRGAKSKGHTQG
jgi:hypothetical protein